VVLRPQHSVPTGAPGPAGGGALTSRLAIEDRSDELFWCSHFERELARKHCLRRQTDLRKDGGAWLPVLPFCATSCSLGRENRALLAGVAAEPCGDCGAALIGDEECSTCRERRELHLVKPRAVPRPPPQGRIWAGGVPDVPIGGSGPRITNSAAPQREERPMRAAPTLPTPLAPANQKPPAIEPAEERSMKGKRSKPCPGCQTVGTRCKKSCPTTGGEAGAKPTEVSPTATPVPTAPVLLAGDKIELRLASDDEVLALAAAVRNELALREHAAALRLATLQRARAAA
jgi:hypothetical protein